MKYTCKSALLAAAALAASIVAAPSFANPFNDGTTYVQSTDTNYNGTLYVGIQNPDNELIIQGGATASATDVVIGQLTGSTNNTVSVVGSSRLVIAGAETNGLATGGVVVGGTDGETVLSLNNDSTLNTEYLHVGFGTDDSGSVELSGEGTTLNATAGASIGSAGSTNTIEISDGATLKVGGTLSIGSSASSNNLINVNAGGNLYVDTTNSIDVVNADDDNGIVVGGDGTLQIGGDVDTSSVEDQGVELQANANLELGGTLTLDQNRIDSRLNVILNDDLSTNTASWTSSALTVIGRTTSDNSLTFTNGATGHVLNIIQIGQQSTSRRNKLTVGGSNSLFTADSDVFVGAQGSNNKLNIGAGGRMDIGDSLYLGGDVSSTGNEVNVGSNGILNITGDVLVGDNGGSSEFSSDYGTVGVGGNLILGNSSIGNRYNQIGGTNTISGSFILGQTQDASGDTDDFKTDSRMTSGNLAFIGTNAVLMVEQDLTVGLEGEGSVLVVRDGGAMTVEGDVVIGENAGDNVIYLQRGSNTTFHVTGDMVIGNTEKGSNRYASYGGTATIDGSIYMGTDTNQHSIRNFIHLDTTNAVLNVANDTYVGASNSLNTLEVFNGAEMNTRNLMVGTYEGTHSNSVFITGEGSMLSISNTLQLGSTTGTNNTIVVQDGGTLSVEQTGITLAGTNNTLTFADGGTLQTVDWDFAALTGSATNILFESGSSLHLMGVLSGTNKVENSMTYTLDGTNAQWDTGTNRLYVGDATDGNTLIITNGASASSGTNLIIGAAGKRNLISVGGTNSWLAVGNDLFIGTETNTSTLNIFGQVIATNTLEILSGAHVDIGNDAYLYRGARLKIDSRSQMQVSGDYAQDRFSTLVIGVGTNQSSPNLAVAGTADFASGATLSVYNDGIGKDDTNLVQNVVVAGELTIDEQAASTGLLLDSLTIETNQRLGFNITVSNAKTIVLDNFIVRSLGEAAGLEGQLLEVADEIELLAGLGNTNAQNMISILDKNPATAGQIMDNNYGEKMSSSPAHNTINLGVQSVAEQLTKRADNTRARMGAAHAGRSTPTGAQGPHMEDQQLQGWITGFKTWADRSADDGFDSYDGSINGFLVGADLSVAKGLLFGVAGGAANATMDKNNGGSSDTSTKFGTLYGSAGTRDWFADASLIYGQSSVDTSLGAVLGTSADYDAENVAVYLGGGKEITGDYLIITPQGSLLGNYYSQDGYVETSAGGLPRRVDSMDTFYLQSAIGCSMGLYTAMGDIILKPELRAFWLHEFNAKEEDVAYSIIGGTGSYNMQLQAPESDIIKLGGGVSAKLGEYLEVRADLDARMAGSYSDYTMLGSIRYQF